ncbi:hypothetical protein N7461_001315 [Penicillium sp. DV-2018c]|nr:hypothetical protein N7461_001315 [Penicillium sp. DV-2018c]
MSHQPAAPSQEGPSAQNPPAANLFAAARPLVKPVGSPPGQGRVIRCTQIRDRQDVRTTKHLIELLEDTSHKAYNFVYMRMGK